MNQNELIVPLQMEGQRLDGFLSQILKEHSRSYLQKLIEDQKVLRNGKPAKKNDRLQVDDCIKITIPPPEPLEIQPENIPLDIVYEDRDLLVVNKPKGMVVHPAAGNYEKTLVNALLFYCGNSLSGINGVIRPGIVHRIDKNTSGLLIVAKNDQAHQGLAEQIKEHSFLREYEAVVYGRLKEEEGSICKPIGRSKLDRKKMCVTEENSRNAVTHFRLLEQFREFAHIQCRLETGRTHQIRVHMASIGHPVAGDEVYGPKKVISSLQGQCLHAKTIGFLHPVTGEDMYFESNLPEYFCRFLKECAK